MDQYIGRIVVLLTPIFAGLSGWIAQLAAEHLPGGPALDEKELTAIFVAGALAVIPPIVTWLINRGKHERNELKPLTPIFASSGVVGATVQTTTGGPTEAGDAS